jgi:hypothetical protein
VQAWKGPYRCRWLRLPGFLDNRYVTVAKFSAVHTGCLYCSGDILVFIADRGHSAAGRIKSKKNPNDPIGNRTRDLPACSAVPHITTASRTPNKYTSRQIKPYARNSWLNFYLKLFNLWELITTKLDVIVACDNRSTGFCWLLYPCWFLHL